MDKYNTPVLFLIFNRPDTTQRVFQKIREAQPPKLYVAADGPRDSRVGERERCNEVRRIATDIDWNCDVKTLFRDNNLGCRVAVSEAIDWFFDNEEMGIILEDDCLPDKTFFRYCEELLFKYRDEDSVMTISGNNFQPCRRTERSYYFSRYMHCWGWAGWKKGWKHYDREMKSWPILKNQNFIEGLFRSKKARRYWNNIFDQVYEGNIDSWAYIWQYSIWVNNGLNILPETNLVTNIGFGTDGTHTKNFFADNSNMVTHPIELPLNHPDLMLINTRADRYTQFRHFQPPFLKKAYRKITRIVINTLWSKI
jgi:hypothetical protein